MEKELLDMVEYLLGTIDPDGFCENGWACGECENCRELHEITEKFSKYSKQLRIKEKE